MANEHAGFFAVDADDLSRQLSPSLLISRSVVERNCSTLLEAFAKMNILVRPHFKTHKCLELAHAQASGSIAASQQQEKTAANFAGFVVSTMIEAEQLVRSNFKHITYGVPISPEKVAWAIAFAHKHDANLSIILDALNSIEHINGAADAFHSRNGSLPETFRRLKVFIKIDAGYHRAGVSAHDDAVQIARAVNASKHLELLGIYVHAGNAYSGASQLELEKYLIDEATAAKAFAAHLRASGITVSAVSIGSTPSIFGGFVNNEHSRTNPAVAAALQGITEVHPGNYVLFDRHQQSIGACSVENIAVCVVARVIGVYPERREFIVDVGALALSKDPGPSHLFKTTSYGAVVGHPTWRIERVSQEVSVITGISDPAELPAYGQVLRIIPNHSCLTMACYTDAYLVDETGHIDTTPIHPVRGWHP